MSRRTFLRTALLRAFSLSYFLIDLAGSAERARSPESKELGDVCEELEEQELLDRLLGCGTLCKLVRIASQAVIFSLSHTTCVKPMIIFCLNGLSDEISWSAMSIRFSDISVEAG